MTETILVVEDELSLQETLAYNLKREGYTIEAVGDGRTALESARRLKPDLIVLDIMLPEMDGFEVARILRKEMPSSTTRKSSASPPSSRTSPNPNSIPNLCSSEPAKA